MKEHPTLQTREARLWHHAVAAHQRLGFLSEAGRVMSETLDESELWSRLMRIVVPAAAQWCSVNLLDDEGRLGLRACDDVEPDRAELLREFRRCCPEASAQGLNEVLASGRAALLDGLRVSRSMPRGHDCVKMVRRLARGSWVCIPMTAGGKALGVLSFGNSRGGRKLNMADLKMGEELALRCALAIQNSRLYQRARRAEDSLTKAVAAAHMVAWNWDLRSGRVERTPNAHEVYGAPPDVDLGNGLELLHPEDRQVYEGAVSDAVAGCGFYAVRFRIVRADGSLQWMEDHGTIERDAAGRPLRIWGVALDITQSKLAEDVLRESERNQREFVANVSHEFRTPVAAIKGFAETLLKGGLEDARHRRRFVRIIESHADRLGWLVEDVLTLSSLESGKELRLERADLGAFVAEYLSEVRQSRGVAIVNGVPLGLKVCLDRRYFAQVLENLITNAVKYNRPGGHVWLGTANMDGRVRLTVRDDGIGISEADLRRVFDRFFRVDKGACHGHAGLGLHICKKIMEAHGGRLWAESQPGKGSAFHVELSRGPNCRRKVKNVE